MLRIRGELGHGQYAGGTGQSVNAQFDKLHAVMNRPLPDDRGMKMGSDTTGVSHLLGMVADLLDGFAGPPVEAGAAAGVLISSTQGAFLEAPGRHAFLQEAMAALVAVPRSIDWQNSPSAYGLRRTREVVAVSDGTGFLEDAEVREELHLMVCGGWFPPQCCFYREDDSELAVSSVHPANGGEGVIMRHRKETEHLSTELATMGGDYRAGASTGTGPGPNEPGSFGSPEAAERVGPVRLPTSRPIEAFCRTILARSAEALRKSPHDARTSAEEVARSQGLVQGLPLVLTGQHGTPRFVEGIRLHIPSGLNADVSGRSPEKTVLAFFKPHSDVFEFDARASSTVVRRRDRYRNRSVLRIQQIYEGIPVAFSDSVIHFLPSGDVGHFAGMWLPADAMATSVYIDSHSARKVLVGAAPGTAILCPPELVLVDPHVWGGRGSVHPFWRIRARARGGFTCTFYIDSWRADLLWVDCHARFGPVLRLFDAKGSIAFQDPLDLLAGWGLFSVPPTPPPAGLENEALQVMQHMKLIASYWDFQFGWSSYDGSSSPTQAAINWNKGDFAPAWMGYAGPEKEGQHPAELEGKPFACFQAGNTSLDWVAHEFAHALTGATAKLVYWGQSGAVDEHLADALALTLVQPKNGLLYGRSRGSEVARGDLNVMRPWVSPMGGFVGSTSYGAEEPKIGPMQILSGNCGLPAHMTLFAKTVSGKDWAFVPLNRAILTAAYGLMVYGSGPTPYPYGVESVAGCGFLNLARVAHHVLHYIPSLCTFPEYQAAFQLACVFAGFAATGHGDRLRALYRQAGGSLLSFNRRGV